MVLKSVQERRCEKRREEARRVVTGRGERTTKQEFGRGVGGVRFCEGFTRGCEGFARGGREGEERVGRQVVCCGLLRLGRDSSTSTIAG